MRLRHWIGHRRLRAFGAPVQFHWSVFAIAGVLLLISLDSIVHALAAITAYLAIIVIHEFGHAWMARRRHYRVERIQIAMFHGRCTHEAPDYEWDDVAIAWGGVLAQLAVAIPAFILAAVIGRAKLGPFDLAVAMLSRVNLVVALMNLVPSSSTDGAKAWRVIPLAREWWQARRTTRRVLKKWTRR
jgi:Zn-dependent protease